MVRKLFTPEQVNMAPGLQQAAAENYDSIILPNHTISKLH